MKFPKDWSWKLDNDCYSQRSFICRLEKYQITAPDENIDIQGEFSVKKLKPVCQSE